MMQLAALKTPLKDLIPTQHQQTQLMRTLGRLMAKKRNRLVLEWALEYYERGWSIIPIKAGTKRPSIRSWKQYQTKRPDEQQLRKWFGDGKYTSLAVVCGDVSGGLAVLDLDSEKRCQWWNDTHPKLAKTLPTVRTKKGLHIYFRSEPFSKRNGNEVDLLCEGAYAILCPSPDKEWLTPLNGNLPLLDPFEWGLEAFDIKRPEQCINFTEETDDTEETEDTDRYRSQSKVVSKELYEYDSDTIAYVQLAISNTVPRKMHKRNSGIFIFCRWLKANEQLKNMKSAALRPLVKLWWEKAYDNIYTKSFSVTYSDFVHGWKRVKWPHGDDIVKQAVDLALKIYTALPELQPYADEPDIMFLGTILHELQKLAGNEPIYLASRKAAGIVGISHTHICTWYETFEEDGILKKVQEHTNTTADRYRYIGLSISLLSEDKGGRQNETG